MSLDNKKLDLDQKFKLANKYYIDGYFENANLICSTILKRYPANIRFKNLFEKIHRKTNGTIYNFLEPNEKIYSDLMLLFKQNEYHKIIEETSNLIKIFPNSIKILLLKAMSYQCLNDDENALKNYNNVLLRDTKNFFCFKKYRFDIF